MCSWIRSGWPPDRIQSCGSSSNMSRCFSPQFESAQRASFLTPLFAPGYDRNTKEYDNTTSNGTTSTGSATLYTITVSRFTALQQAEVTLIFAWLWIASSRVAHLVVHHQHDADSSLVHHARQFPFAGTCSFAGKDDW
jgi:hypothetical protein